MSKREIEMRPGDAAILLHANGDIGLLIPKLDELGDDDEAPDHVALAMAFGVIARSPVLAHVVKMMAEHAAESVDAQTEPAVTQ
jgi:hypothetical protein